MLDYLNPQQKEAVTHKDGPLLIFAGAGSGKSGEVRAGKTDNRQG